MEKIFFLGDGQIIDIYHYKKKLKNKKKLKIRTPNYLQVAMFVPFSKLASNIEKSYQIFNFSLF